MQLDEMVQCLIAIGASIGADCKPCLQSSIAMARQCGAAEQDIEGATAVGRMVRQCAAKMENCGDGLSNKDTSAVENGSTQCCGSTEINIQEGRSK